MSEFTTWPWTFESDLAAYREAGVDAIEVTQCKLSRPRYEEQLALIGDHGLDVSSVQTTIHSVFQDSLVAEPPDPRHRIAEMLRSISDIAPHVPEETPFVVITGAAPHGDCAVALRVVEEALATLAAHAGSLHMRIAFEPLNPVLFHTDTALWSFGDALDLVERLDDPALGLCLDVWNVWQSPGLHDLIRRAGSRIFLVQVSDWRVPHANADRRSIGDGCIPIASIVETIRATDYRGPYVLEIFSTQSLADSLWSGDMHATIARNRDAFARLWQSLDA